MFSAHTIHVLHVAVRDFFIVLIVLLAAGFFWLIHGITFEKLTFGSYEIDGLYIKLDKKLTLNAKHVIIPKSKAKPSFKNVDKTFDRIKNLLTYFDSIYLEKVDFQNNHFSVFYADDVLYITSDDYEIAGNIERKGNKLVADVSILNIKGYKTTLSGKLSYDLRTHVLETGGTFETFGIKGNFRALKQGDTLVYALNSNPFGNLRPLIERIGMPKVIESWIIDKVRAKKYRLVYLKGKVPIGKKGLKMGLAALKGKARLNDVNITFNEKVAPVHAEEMTLTYEKGNLYFALKHANYKGRSVEGSTVTIKHIVGPQTPVLTLDLHAQTPMDMEVHDILKAYGLYIPLWHSGTGDKAVVTLKIPLVKGKKRIKTTVDVVLDEGKASIAGFPLYTKSGEVYVSQQKATLRRIKVAEPWFRGEVNGELDISTKQADLILDVKRAELGKKHAPIMVMKDQRVPLKLAYDHGVKLFLPTQQVKVVKSKKHTAIMLENLEKIIPYLTSNYLGISGGKLELVTDDLEQFRFSGRLKKDLCFFYEKQNACYTYIPVSGTVDTQNDLLIFEAFNKRLVFNSEKSIVKLHDINIDLKRFIEEQKSAKERSPKSPFGKKSIVIIGKNSELRYDKYRLVTDSYDIEVKPNGDIKAIGIKDGDVVKFTKKGNIFFMQALRIKDKMLHPLINFKGLKGGRYSLKKEGDPSKRMRGRIIIEGGILSDFKAYSNTLAFINTLPALATLNKPGFSSEGFKIEEGVIDYIMTPQKIVFESVYLKGNTATVVGKGTVWLTGNKRVDVDLAIQTVREFGKVVGKIPLLGYILMGDDNSMTVGLKIGGTLDEPKVSTSVAKDILTLPLEILKRTITAPAHMNLPKQQAPDIPDSHQKSEPKQNTQENKRRTSLKQTSAPSEKKSLPTRSAAPSTDPSGQLF